MTPPTPQTRRPRSLLFAALLITAVLMSVLAAALASGLIFDTADKDTAPTPTPVIGTDFAPDAVTDRAFPSLTYGIHAFLWWNPTIRTIDLDNIRLMAFSHVKQRFSWANMEPVQGQWDWDEADSVVHQAECRGLDLIARLDGPPEWAITAPQDATDPPVDVAAWGEFCGTLAERFAGRIAGYQVWNEPNLDREWLGYPPNAEGYVEMLAACATAIHAADPNAVVISAGLAPTGDWLPTAIPDMDYLRFMYDAGAAD